jgi:hypothetical protein
MNLRSDYSMIEKHLPMKHLYTLLAFWIVESYSSIDKNSLPEKT